MLRRRVYRVPPGVFCFSSLVSFVGCSFFRMVFESIEFSFKGWVFSSIGEFIYNLSSAPSPSPSSALPNNLRYRYSDRDTDTDPLVSAVNFLAPSPLSYLLSALRVASILVASASVFIGSSLSLRMRHLIESESQFTNASICADVQSRHPLNI